MQSITTTYDGVGNLLSFTEWTQRDPVGGSLGDPNSINGYIYAKDDPVNFTDPSGAYEPPVATCIAGAIIGAIVGLIAGLIIGILTEGVALIALLLEVIIGAVLGCFIAVSGIEGILINWLIEHGIYY